ncbi:hypothetical protein [Sorangium sp. So ce1024]|uniref:hypothetical protein n=1 Tax=Sorangium sp. So ce1024 TaxID=3133327 RepID=UPI003F0FD037
MSRLRTTRLSSTVMRRMMCERACGFEAFADATEREIEAGRFDLDTGPDAARIIAKVLRRSADADWEARPSRLRGGAR